MEGGLFKKIKKFKNENLLINWMKTFVCKILVGKVWFKKNLQRGKWEVKIARDVEGKS